MITRKYFLWKKIWFCLPSKRITLKGWALPPPASNFELRFNSKYSKTAWYFSIMMKITCFPSSKFWSFRSQYCRIIHCLQQVWNDHFCSRSSIVLAWICRFHPPCVQCPTLKLLIWINQSCFIPTSLIQNGNFSMFNWL